MHLETNRVTLLPSRNSCGLECNLIKNITNVFVLSRCVGLIYKIDENET